jgi:hypothetical protein
MSRSSLKFLAVLLATLIVVVLFAGLDNLPRSVRAEIVQERSALAAAQKQVSASGDEVTHEVQGDAALFGAIAASKLWPGQLAQAQSQLSSAARDADELARLEKANRRQDEARVRALVSEERNLRSAAVAQSSGVQQQAAQWLERKRQLPAGVAAMERDYQAIHGFNLAPITATVGKAEADWPEKKPDLEARAAALGNTVAEGEKAWQSSAEDRRAAAARDYAHLNIATLFGAEDTLHTAAAELPQKAAELPALAGQLYNNWDKLLVDMEVRGRGDARQYEQKVRTVRTHLADSSAKNGQVTSDEQWVNVSPATYQALQNDLGMAIEHKPAGKYDMEAEHVAQPAGFAYMAPPGQSNQYGSWEHHDGRDFWVFYGQYALMRDLLFNHNYRPIDRYDWDGYRTYQQRGQTYYGRDEAGSAPKYGSQGTVTQDRYSGSSYAKSGGFKDSRYASKSGSYRNTPYASPNGRQPGGDATPKRFGRTQEPTFHAPSPRPSPRPSFRPPSAGRRFGRR